MTKFKDLIFQINEAISMMAIEMEPEKKNIHNFLAFKRHLEKELGRKVDLGIESALKPVARKFIEKEIVYV